MKNQDTALKDAEENSEPTPPVEDKPTEEVEEPTEPVEVEGAPEPETEPQEEPTETEDKPKKGLNKRVRKVVSERNEARDEVKTLKDHIAQLQGSDKPGTGPVPNFPQQAQDEPIVAPGEEIDVVELDRRIKARDNARDQRTRATVELAIKQSQAQNRIANEMDAAVKKYPELDQDSEDFNRDLSDSISSATWAQVKSAPYSASVTKIVDGLMKPYQGAVSKGVGKATKTMAKQASQAALRPTSVKQGEKDAKDKSIAELESELPHVQA